MMTNSQNQTAANCHPARSIDELEQRSQRTNNAFGFSLWKLLLAFNCLGFTAGVARYLWGQPIGDAVVTIVLIGALAPMTIFVYHSAILVWDHWVPRRFVSPVHDVLDDEDRTSPKRIDAWEDS